MEELFNNLESNDSLTVEQAKGELTKSFSQTKEPWLVCGMMDYFNQMRSPRIVDVLVKVREPHDGFIFDKLLDWVTTSKRTQAFELFWLIVKKQPSWLYKVASHQFFKEILRVLRTEHNIVTTMSALFCILILIPIIPTQIPHYLLDMFEIFMYLATWKTKNVPELTGNQMIHLQMGILKLFQTLYAMFPCNFTAYLRNNTKENQTVFATTINPLLETVKMHPMLLASNKDSERQRSWKEMEPHDVFVECSKFSVDDGDRNYENDARGGQEYQNSNYASHTLSAGTNKNVLSPFDPNSALHAILAADRNKVKTQQKMDTIWSPSVTVLATPPPTNAVTHTPTPTPIGIQTIAMGQYQTGASPPEAAIEATPETTPMKDYIKPHRPFPVNSTAARTIWANSSQPSSPLKKEDTTSFRFSESRAIEHMRNFEHEIAVATNSPKLLKLINDRNVSQQLLLDRHHNVKDRVFDIEIPDIEVPDNIEHARNMPPIEHDDSQEDQEVIEINQRQISQSQLTKNNNEHPDDDQEGEKKSRKSLAQCYQNSNMESFDLYRRRAEENHSESDDDVSNRNISKSWPGLKLKMPRNDHKTNNNAHVDNGNVQKDLGAIEETEMCSVAIQTTEQYLTYEHMYVDLLTEELQRKKNSPSIINSTPMSPHNLLDQYIEISTRKIEGFGGGRNDADIQLLTLLLQYERYRREVYAERNRRLLGKCRDSAALKMDNDKLKNSTELLLAELQTMSKNLNKARLEQSAMEQDNFAQCSRLRNEVQAECEKNKRLCQTIETLERNLKEDSEGKKLLTSKLEKAQADIFDLKNLLQQCQLQADVGNQYKDELRRLQAEMALIGEIQMKCKDKMAELNSLQARDADFEILRRSYSDEVHECRKLMEQKSAQLDGARERVSSLESALSRKDHLFAEQKRLLKTVKEEYQEKMKALEAKYSTQKAIIIRQEEAIFELFKNKSTEIKTAPESEKTTATDIAGSLDHTSPLSISLASSEGLSASLRSVTEIKNLQTLVGSTDTSPQSVRPNKFTKKNTNGVATAAVPVPIQRVSDDIPVPIPGSSQNIHHHHHH